MIVLDTSAIMAVLDAEPEGPAVVSRIERAEQTGEEVILPFLVLVEVEYVLLRKHAVSDVEQTLNFVLGWPTELVESFEEWRREAARVKSAGNISIVDAWVAALALLTGAEVLHKDPQFLGVDGLLQLDIRQ